MKKKLIATIVAAMLSASAMAGNEILVNEYIKAGVNESTGTLGSGGNTSPGLLYDSTGTGTFTVNSKGTTDPLCQSECDAATTPCTGYQWDSSKTSCSIISDKTPVLDTSETSGTMTCNVPTKIM